MEGRECTDKEIRLVHTQSVLNALKKGENISSSLDLGNDVCINKYSKTSLQYAVGSYHLIFHIINHYSYSVRWINRIELRSNGWQHQKWIFYKSTSWTPCRLYQINYYLP